MPEKLLNDRLLRALRRQPVDMTPLWIMRQAGRYLPEYRATRQRAGGFMTLCKTPELACEVTLQPLDRFDLDAAILFSDILTIPDAMGLGLSVVENKGPQFARPVRTGSDIRNLGVPDVETSLRYVMDAVRLIKRELQGKVPLIGFAGSPWTIATYMIEGESSKNFSRAKGMLYGQSDLMHMLLDVLSRSITDYLNGQIAAGGDVVMVFDTWGGILSRDAYQEFSLGYMKRIVQGIKAEGRSESVPVILFTKGGGLWLEDIAGSGCDAIGVDWTVDIDAARRRTGGKVALQGNLDTAVLYSSPASIRRQVAEILAAYGPADGHVFNLGHGIHPDIDPDKVAVLVDAVHELSRPFHARK
ncbi:MAG: uroporphyrinogen decarboxylase [Gammaproteobacteria bacterium]|nr:uroporphyrinogen decarboxylase [Gammaproteobacteria bacterium]